MEDTVEAPLAAPKRKNDTDSDDVAWGRAKRGVYSLRDIDARPVCETPLSVWLAEKQMPMAEFARRLGTTNRTVSLWSKGKVIPTLAYAFRIDAETNGAVSPSMWLGTDIGRATWLSVGGKL